MSKYNFAKYAGNGQAKLLGQNRIVLAYCIYDSVKAQTFMDAITLAGSGLITSVVCSTASLLPFARNDNIAGCYNQCPDFTHILVVDGDMHGVTIDLVEKLVAQDVDVICPVMTFRRPPFHPAIDPDSFNLLIEELKKPSVADRQVIEVKRVGFGCTLIKRHILDKIKEVTPEGLAHWVTCDRFPRKEFYDELAKEVETIEKSEEIEPKDIFKRGVAAGLNAHLRSPFLGEDFNFSDRVSRVGGKLYCHSGLYIGHQGEIPFDINDWLAWLEEKDKTKLKTRLVGGNLVWSRDE